MYHEMIIKTPFGGKFFNWKEPDWHFCFLVKRRKKAHFGDTFSKVIPETNVTKNERVHQYECGKNVTWFFFCLCHAFRQSARMDIIPIIVLEITSMSKGCHLTSQYQWSAFKWHFVPSQHVPDRFKLKFENHEQLGFWNIDLFGSFWKWRHIKIASL